jgi:hypothetical protein
MSFARSHRIRPLTDYSAPTCVIRVVLATCDILGCMKLAGFLLLLSGWMIALTAIAILPQAGTRAAFLLAGVAVEIVGLVLVFRSHIFAKEERG